jgi:hypothetical protein
LEKARIDFINRRFYHMYDLNPQYASRIDPAGQSPAAIYDALRSKGAPDDCYVFGGSDLDQSVVPLADALEAVVGWCDGTFISCVPGKLAYFEGEDPGERYLLRR